MVASVFLSLGIALLKHMNFLIGGTAGIAFLLHYTTGITYGKLFFAINLPFYVLGVWKLGKEFTLKTFIAVFLVSFCVDYLPYVYEFGDVNPIYGAALAGFLIGNGLLMLFRHKASLGGLNIVALYMQKYKSMSAGKFQMAVDICIVVAAFFTVNMSALLYSVLAAIFLNLILAVYHKPGRYMVVS